MFRIENEQLVVAVNTKGGELDSIYSKQTKLNYLWSGDPAFWNRKSPVLFPIVGQLKDNKYIYNDREFSLSRHGFARDREFTCTLHNNHSIVMTLESDEESLKVYPFPFRLDIEYAIAGDSLFVKYTVTNKGSQNMLFSIGAHPAFRVPLEEGLEYHDYYFQFEKNENAGRWLISDEGLIDTMSVPVLTNSNKLPISKSLFANDALVFKHLASNVISIRTDKSTHGLDCTFEGFDYMGLWAAPNADFVCIEPWCGIADSTESQFDFKSKEGIHMIMPAQHFTRTWSVRCY